MSPKRSGGSGALLESIRSGTSSVRLVLSQLKTRRKEAPVKSGAAPVMPGPEAPRWGHLILLEKVGKGSFGEVYRALDTKLEREVALKLLDARQSEEDPALLEEARMLARLRHDNVVTVYGVDCHDNRFGMWMDFIHGKTLEQVLEEHGPLGAREAVLVGLEVGRALAAVHHRGLVHRDVKTQNVMREEGGRIVLMDFGLGFDAATAPAEDMGGTPVYMAPELFEEQPASVRSDIYALGVLLYHLVTGRYPVVGATVAEIKAAHADGSVQLITDARPDLPSPFTRVVERATSPEPSRRFATAGQMRAALDATLQREGGRLTPKTVRVLFGIAALFLAAVLAWGVWWLMRPSAAVQAGGFVLFTEVTNATGDKQLDAVTELVRTELTQSRHFNLLDADQVKETLKRMTRPPNQKLDPPVAREVALRSGAPLLIYGTVSPFGSGYALSVKLERIQGRPSPPVASFVQIFEALGGKNSLFDAIHEAGTWVRQKCGEASKEIAEADRRPDEATTNSWEALDYYTQGERLAIEYRFEDALAMYMQAARTDPEFALALMKVGQMQSTLRRAPEAFSYCRRAVEAIEKRPPSRREELRFRGYYANLTDDYANGESFLRTLTLLYPQDARAYGLRAFSLRNLGRLEEAREQLEKAERMRHQITNLVNLAMVNVMLGDSAQAATNIAALRMAQPQRAQYIDGIRRLLIGDLKGAEQCFAGLIKGGDGEFRSIGYGSHACMLAESGRQRAALEMLEEGIAADSRAGNPSGLARKLLALAALNLERGDRHALHTAALQAAYTESTSRTFQRAGTLLARGGFVAEARDLLRRMQFPGEGQRQEINKAILTGEIFLAEGHTDQALSELRKAAAIAPPIQPREYLAHALEHAGQVEEALALYQNLVTAPISIWQVPDDQEPGLWTRCMLHAAELAERTGRVEDARRIVNRFLKVRGQGDSDSSELVAAQKLLSRL